MATAGAVEHSPLLATTPSPGHAAARRTPLLALRLPKTANNCLQPEKSFFSSPHLFKWYLCGCLWFFFCMFNFMQ